MLTMTWRSARILLVTFMLVCNLLAGCTSEPPHSNNPNGKEIDWSGLFHDQGPLYDSAVEPTCNTPVTLSLRTLHQNVSSAHIKYYDSADKASHLVNMPVPQTDSPHR